MSAFSWQCQNLCLRSLAFIIDWRVVSKIWNKFRFGLWISDLSVTQIMQEKVPEAHRGKINGVQNGMQELMNVIKYVLVVVLPRCDH